MTKRIVLISCVSRKLGHAAKTKDLYISPLFQLNLRYARQWDPDKIYVLSAKYGLLDLDSWVDPYDQTLNDMRTAELRQWAERVLKKLRQVSSLENTEFIFLAGQNYRRFLIAEMKHLRIPLEGLPIGRQFQKLKELTQ